VKNKEFYAHLLALDYDVPDDAYMPTLGRARQDDDY
jgi:hypothetical protein